MASYATPTQFRERYDVRTLGDFAADDGTQVSSGGVLTDANIQAMLDDASGAIEAALRNAGRYTVEQLAALANYTSKHLVRICCDLAMSYLIDRRVYGKLNDAQTRIMERAAKQLDDLKTGRDVLEVEGAIDAGVPSVSGPTSMQLDNLNLIARRSYRYYPTPLLPGER
jgi:phage gp36-like protein